MPKAGKSCCCFLLATTTVVSDLKYCSTDGSIIGHLCTDVDGWFTWLRSTRLTLLSKTVESYIVFPVNATCLCMVILSSTPAILSPHWFSIITNCIDQIEPRRINRNLSYDSIFCREWLHLVNFSKQAVQPIVGPPHYAPARDLRPFDLESGVRVTWHGYLYANFSLPRPLSRLRSDLYCVEWDVKLYYTIPYLGLSVLNLGPMYATDVRQTDIRRASSLNAPYRYGQRHNNKG